MPLSATQCPGRDVSIKRGQSRQRRHRRLCFGWPSHLELAVHLVRMTPEAPLPAKGAGRGGGVTPLGTHRPRVDMSIGGANMWGVSVTRHQRVACPPGALLREPLF